MRDLHSRGAQLCAAVALLLYAGAGLWAQTTAFAYQGKLTDAGNPATGDFDLQFKLYDALANGNQQGPTLVRTPVTAAAGVFSVTLDFTASVFGGADRYLEIGVRPAGSGDGYSILAPRQAITSSPYAIQTLNAQQLGGIPASGFIQNTTSLQAPSNFNVSGTGVVGTLDVNGAITQAGVAAPPVALATRAASTSMPQRARSRCRKTVGHSSTWWALPA